MSSTEADVSCARQRLPESVSERAGERLFAYAHVQRQSRKSAVEAQRSAETAGLFHPEVRSVAKGNSARHGPLYAAATPMCVQSVRPDEASANGSSPSAVPRCWRAFLSRAFDWERQRIARLQELRLQVVEGAVKECTFHPRLSPHLCACGACNYRHSAAASHAADFSVTREHEKQSSRRRRERWAAALAMFEAEMEELQDTLVRLRHM
ncbi:hypothetical protein LSCM4_05544 [Leishmania orientalis]|uniref:Uncharacterized protein n=1 Tax=Leishmania orientalis TaxID=2249476 RepID=A0A836HQE9_9TRYP|nr:hypothetical protein LSCM4_05544 [Leishmania orientalis]